MAKKFPKRILDVKKDYENGFILGDLDISRKVNSTCQPYKVRRIYKSLLNLIGLGS
jgi:hypothetical protein